MTSKSSHSKSVDIPEKIKKIRNTKTEHFKSSKIADDLIIFKKLVHYVFQPKIYRKIFSYFLKSYILKRLLFGKNKENNYIVNQLTLKGKFLSRTR